MSPKRLLLMSKPNVYAAIIEEIFKSKFNKGMTRVDFERPRHDSGPAGPCRLPFP